MSIILKAVKIQRKRKDKGNLILQLDQDKKIENKNNLFQLQESQIIILHKEIKG